MAETRLADVIVDDRVFTEYTMEPNTDRFRFWKSGVAQRSNLIDSFVNGGGQRFVIPGFKSTLGDTGEVPSETVAQTINAINSGEQVARRQLRTKAWGENDISYNYAGKSPLESAAQRVTDYWSNVYDQLAIKSMVGVFADNAANDSGDLINDITGGAGAAANFSDDGVTDTMKKLGENGVIGRADEDDFVAIAVHSDTYFQMQKDDLITFVPISDQTRPLPFYRSMQVIVDDNLPKTGTPGAEDYETYILKAGALLWGLGSNGYKPTEMWRQPGTGFGISELYTRRAFAIHPVGFAYDKATDSDVSPSDADLEAATSWDRAYDKGNIRMVMFNHKIGQS